MKILFLGGGSAGHVIPNLRLIDHYIEKYSFEAYYVGFNGYIEEKLCKNKSNLTFLGVKRPKRRLQFILSKKIYKEIKSILDKIKIDLVISTGGGHSYHGLLYAKRNKIPYYLIEENMVLGSVNKLFYHKSTKIFTSFKIGNKKKYIHTLNPSALITKHENNIKYDFLFIGGSLGSDVIANVAIKMRRLPYQSLLIAGRKYNKYKKYQNDNLKVVEFIDTSLALSESDIVITRCGSSTLFELVALNKKMVLVPSLKTKKNHQVLNAKEFARLNLGIYINEHDLDDASIINLKNYNFDQMLDAQKNYLKDIGMDNYEEYIFKNTKQNR